jgi:hypothetical protein
MIQADSVTRQNSHSVTQSVKEIVDGRGIAKEDGVQDKGDG